jgi:hypothetical protein
MVLWAVTVRVTGGGTGKYADSYRDKVKNSKWLGLGVTGVTGKKGVGAGGARKLRCGHRAYSGRDFEGLTGHSPLPRVGPLSL